MSSKRRITVLAFAAFASACAHRGSVDTTRILTYEQHAQLSLRTPYVLEYRAGDGRLLVVGVGHTSEANNPAIGKIWAEWTGFHPSVAYFEGTDVEAGADPETISIYGEPAVVRFLAIANRVPVTSIEPDMVDEITYLKERWNTEQIKLFYTLRFVTERSANGGKPAQDSEVANYLAAGFPPLPSLSGPPQNLAELAVSYATYFPQPSSWRSANPDWFSPLAGELFSNKMARSSGRFRDEYMLKKLVEATQRGNRVFVAIGSVHAHMLEPALTQALGTPARTDNGS